MKPHPDTARFARILFDEAKSSGVERPVFEIRIVKAGREKTLSGYFDSPEAAAAAAATKDGQVEAIYITPNPTVVECFARSANKLKPYAEATTSDAQIASREWLLVDIDAVRPKGVSSSKSQHEAARELAVGIRTFLDGLGFPRPILADSGNGAHLMYRVDLPNDEDSKTLVKRCLDALEKRFADPVVKVDTTSFNAARIWKMYGTMACKGDNLPEQPHRRAALIDVPEPLEVATRDILLVLAALAPAPPTPEKKSYRYTEFDLMTWLRQYAYDFTLGDEKALDGGGWVREIMPCPWGDHERDRAAFVGQRASGAIIAGCRHERCKDKKWEDLRGRLDPEWGKPKPPEWRPPHQDEDAPPPDPRASGPAPLRLVPPNQEEAPGLTQDIRAFVGEDEPDQEDVASPQDWIVPDFVPRSALTILGGPPKIGKTFLLLDMALAIARGELFCGHWPTFQGKVLALLEEDTKRRIRMRLWRLARGRGVDPRSFQGSVRLAAMTGFRLDSELMLKKLEQEISMYKPDVLLIDALARVHSADENDRTAMRAVTVPLQHICSQYGIAVVLVHHFKKPGLGDEKKRSGDLLRGSSDLLALARSVIGVQRLDDRKGFQVDAAGNDAEVPPAIVQLESGQTPAGKPTIVLRYVGPTAQARVAEDAKLVIDTIRAAGLAGIGTAQLRKDAKLGAERCDEALEHLRTEGKVYRSSVRDKWKLTDDK